MMKKNLLMALAIAVTLVSCAKESLLNNSDVEIAVRSTTIDGAGVATRAPFEGTISSSNTLKARVLSSTAMNFATVTDGTMTFTGSGAVGYDAAGLNGSIVLPATNPVYLFGLYPDANWTYNPGSSAVYTFTGVEDVMATDRVSTNKADITAGTYATLTFQHLLTKLEMKLHAASTTVANAFGNITAIELVDDMAGTGEIKNVVSVANNSDPLTLMKPTYSIDVSNPQTTLSFYGLTSDASGDKVYGTNTQFSYPLTTSSTLMAYSMVAPITATALEEKEYFLKITTANEGAKYIGIDLLDTKGIPFVGSTRGRSFVISIFFKSNNEIMASAAVEDWINEGEWEGEITQ